MMIRRIFSTVIMLLFSSASNAALISRLDDQAFYDTVLDITWLADANYAMTSGYDDDGYMNWQNALLWADQLVFAGYDGWRLAGNKNTTEPAVATCIGFNCDDTEMAYMFYTNLGGNEGASQLTGNQGQFLNIQPQYWADIVIDEEHSINYHFSDGLQFTHPNYIEFAAWAVMDGDIGVVPLPSAVWLFGTGLITLTYIFRHKKTKLLI